MVDSDQQCAVELYGKDRRCNGRRVPGTDYCSQHQREEAPTEADRLAVLRILADPRVSSLPMFDVAHRIHAVPAGDGRTKEHREFQRRSITLIRAQLELHEQELIYEAVHADGENPSEVAITDKGREFLIAAEAGNLY